MTKRERNNPELANFLKRKRESMNPEAFNIPISSRRRTPGLRREEVAAFAGIGLSWYTWLEQGRNINVSTKVLDSLSEIFQLNKAERNHLYFLAQQRAPIEEGETRDHVPKIIQNIISNLPTDYLAYVLNLNWDILDYNNTADKYFQFSQVPLNKRNFLYQLFLNPNYQKLFINWDTDSQNLLSSFRRDYALIKTSSKIQEIITNLNQKSEFFFKAWENHDIYQKCSGKRQFLIENETQTYEYTSLTFDPDKHLRLIIYIPFVEL